MSVPFMMVTEVRWRRHSRVVSALMRSEPRRLTVGVSGMLPVALMMWVRSMALASSSIDDEHDELDGLFLVRRSEGPVGGQCGGLADEVLLEVLSEYEWESGCKSEMGHGC